MEVTYELTLEDVWHYNRYYLQNKAPLRSLLISDPSIITKLGFGFLCLVLLMSFGLAVVSLFQHHSPDWTMLLTPIVALLAISRLLPPSKKRLAKIATQRPGLLCEHIVSISPEWLAERTFVNDTKVAWSTLHTIEEDHNYLFLFLSKNAAYIVPKRAFTGPNEAQAFLDAARRYLDAAKTRTPVTAEDASVWPPAPRPGA